MKRFLLILSLMLPFCVNGQELRDSLTGKSEMKIISSQEKEKSKKINVVQDTTTKTDSEIHIYGEKKFRTISANVVKGSNKNNRHYSKFKGHWSGFYWGLVNFAKNDYSMYGSDDEFMELDWGRSFMLKFNLFDYGINLVPRNNFGLVVGLGFDYQRLCFDNDITVTIDNKQLTPVNIRSEYGINSLKRSTFKTFYLTIPLLAEIQVPAQSNKLHISGGVVGGLRLHSKTKIVYNNDNGKKRKKKEKNNFDMIPFKADVMGQIGYKAITVWGSYSLTSMFKSDRGPDVRPYAFGVGVTF